MNMVKVLEKAGCEVHYNPEQTCCGQPGFNAGYWKEAREVGKKFLDDFSEARCIVAPSGSCVGFVRNFYQKLFENTSYHNQCKETGDKLYELSEFLVDVLKVENLGSSLEGVGTYHDACGALRECKIKEAPRKLLDNVKGLELKEMEACETCCGFGGTFSVKFEPISTGMADQKVDNALATEADFLISTDLSCLMHLDGYIKKQNKKIKTMHLADVLASGL
jgi:L-lactate dehydrogenase complex protein LldE